MGELIVPGPSPAEPKLPPRRRKRKSPESKKPRLKKEIPSGYEPVHSPDKEMHPVLVVAVSLLLFINGWNALDNLIIVPIALWFLPVMVQTVTEMTDEDVADSGSTREELQQVFDGVYLNFAAWFAFSLSQLSMAASMAGILFWRGYAIYYAIASATIRYLLTSILLWESSLLASVNVFALIAIILMLQKLPPVAWPRLMAQDIR